MGSLGCKDFQADWNTGIADEFLGIAYLHLAARKIQFLN